MIEKSKDWGEVDAELEEVRLRNVCRKITDGSHYSPDTQAKGYPYITVSDIKNNKIDFDNSKRISPEAYTTLKEEGCKPDAGDILLSKDGTIGKGAIAPDREFVVLSSLAILSPQSQHDARYLLYILTSDSFIQQVESRMTGAALRRITLDTLKECTIPIGSSSWQNSVTAFLDHYSTKITKAIEKKKSLSSLIEEKRKAVITRAVTKGFKEDIEFQNSSLKETPTYPKHWRQTSLRWGCKSIRDGTHNPPSREPGKYRLLSVKNMQDGWLQFLENDRTMGEEAFEKLQQSYTVEETDVIMAIVGSTTGKVARVPSLDNFTVQRSTAILRPNPRVVSRDFLYYWLQSIPVQSAIQAIFDKYTAQPGIYLDDVSNLPLLVPPLEEQEEISEYLSDQTAWFDQLSESLEKSINLLEEKRQALITAAATGQLDLSDWDSQENQEIPV